MSDNRIILVLSAAVPVRDQVRAIESEVADGSKVLAVIEPDLQARREALARANAMPVTTDEHVQAWVRLAPARLAATALRKSLKLVEPEAEEKAGLSPIVRGPVLDASGRTINAHALENAWKLSPIVVIPAGAARTDDQRPAILSDGSALSTALFIAERLALPVRVLRRLESPWVNYQSVDFDDALELSPPDRRAILFARKHNIRFVLADSSTSTGGTTSIGGMRTVVGRETVLASGPPPISSRVGRVSTSTHTTFERVSA